MFCVDGLLLGYFVGLFIVLLALHLLGCCCFVLVFALLACLLLFCLIVACSLLVVSRVLVCLCAFGMVIVTILCLVC